jgi:uncharacterized surface anchored protein
LHISKIDAVTKQPIKGAKFLVTKKSGDVVGEYTTDNYGTIMLTSLSAGWLRIVETYTPVGFILDDTPKEIEVTSNQYIKVVFENQPLASIQIKKVDEFSNAPLSGAVFSVSKQNGEFVGEYTTDSSGAINISGVLPGWYVLREVQQPYSYHLDNTPKTVEVKAATPTVVTFTNRPLSGIEIQKFNSATKAPLPGATFTIERDNGEKIGTYKTDASGKILVTELTADTYLVSEVQAPDGFFLSEAPQIVIVKSNKLSVVTFNNEPLSGLQIVKIDAVTKQPIKGAKFTVYKQSGEIVGTYDTNADGVIILPRLSPGWYKAAESKASDGYLIDDTPQDFQITSNQFVKLVFENQPLASIQIRKINALTGAPLANAVFVVRRQNGEYIGEYTTGISGNVSVPATVPGWFVIQELTAPAGFELDSVAKTVEVKPAIPSVVTFADKPLSGIEILKTDAKTGVPLQGAVFTVDRVNGERIGKYTTDISGKILVPDLSENVYIISEVQAPAEYILDAIPQTVEVKSGKLTIAEFSNKPFPYLYIKKVDASTGALLAGAQFTIATQGGVIVASVTSIASGAVAIKVAPGVFTITEVKPPSNYKLNDPVQTVEVLANGSLVYYSDMTFYSQCGIINRKRNRGEKDG